MTATSRTDIHRPSAADFDPESYDFVGCYDLDAGASLKRALQNAVAELNARDISAANVHPVGQCSHCGAHLRYAALMVHVPSQTYVWIGEQCLGNRFESLTAGEFQELRKAAALNRDRIRKTDKIAAFVIEYPALATLADADATHDVAFLDSLGYQLRDKGELTERQITAAIRIMGEADQRAAAATAKAAKEAQWAAERAAAAPAPVGRVKFAGEVVMIRSYPSDMTPSGEVIKMIVKTAVGWRVFVTVPAAIEAGLERGMRVELTATLKIKDTSDLGFATGSRPTGAAITERPALTLTGATT